MTVRLLFYICTLLACSVAGTTLAQQGIQAPASIDYKALGAPMPPFSVRINDRLTINEQNVSTFEHVIVVLFNPTCDHCIALGKEVAHRHQELKNTTWIFIAAPGMDEYLTYFLEPSGLDKVRAKNIFVGTDQTPNAGLGNSFTVFLAKIFEYKLPQVNIYNHQRKMSFKSLGETSFDAVAKAIKQGS